MARNGAAGQGRSATEARGLNPAQDGPLRRRTVEEGTGGEPHGRIPKPRVVGSNPIARSSSTTTRVSAVSHSPEPGEKANAHPLCEAIEVFLMTKQVAG